MNALEKFFIGQNDMNALEILKEKGFSLEQHKKTAAGFTFKLIRFNKEMDVFQVITYNSDKTKTINKIELHHEEI